MAAYSSQLLEALNEQRLNNQNCDLVLISKDQQQFVAHRFLLAASSTYMSETLLTPGVTQVLMDDLDGVTLKVLLDVVYSGTLNLPPNLDNESDVTRLQELGRAFGIQVLVDLCSNYKENKTVSLDPKAGGDNALSTNMDLGTLKTTTQKRSRKTVKTEPDLDEVYNGFKRKRYPKLTRGPDGKFHRPPHENAEDNSECEGITESGDDDDESEKEGGDDDYKPPRTQVSRRGRKPRKSHVHYMRSGKHKWSKKPSIEEITKEIERQRKLGIGKELGSDEESDISLDIDDIEPDDSLRARISDTLTSICERIGQLQSSSNTDNVDEEKVSTSCPETEEDINEWKNCTYCSQFRGRKKGRYDFHQSFCRQARLKCDVCFKPFLTERDRTAHRCKKTVESVICDICGKVLRDIQSMKLHMDVHNNVKKYPCPHCGKLFRRTTQRAAHVVHVHTKERPHVCNTCGARFALKYELNRHMQRHSEFPTFACGHCDKFFYERTKLSFHIKHHHSQSYQQEQQTILAIATSAMNSNEVEIEVHTTPQELDSQPSKPGEVLGYIHLPVSASSEQHVQTLTAIDQLTQAASNAHQQEYIQLTPMSYEGQNYYVYQQ